ncbi:SH3 domain-containing protein [Streptomyces sp. NPDC039022]|uniref:SH3 domain-containing protein n=1 Tax=Streptomyces sp. NPDC039022 TaxID=3157091 RepID=UPI003407CAC4
MIPRKSALALSAAVSSAALALSISPAEAVSSSSDSAAAPSRVSSRAADSVKILVDGVHIRANATTKSPSLGLAYKSHKVTFLASVRGENVNGEFNWVKVRDNTTGVTGYINGAYVQT